MYDRLRAADRPAQPIKCSVSCHHACSCPGIDHWKLTFLRAIYGYFQLGKPRGFINHKMMPRTLCTTSPKQVKRTSRLFSVSDFCEKKMQKNRKYKIDQRCVENLGGEWLYAFFFLHTFDPSSKFSILPWRLILNCMNILGCMSFDKKIIPMPLPPQKNGLDDLIGPMSEIFFITGTNQRSTKMYQP